MESDSIIRAEHLRRLSPVSVGLVFSALFIYHSLADGYPIGPDGAVYLLSGESTVSGEITYRYFFDPKPPGPHLVSTALHLPGFSREQTYLLSVAVMLLVTIGIAASVVHVVHRVTDEPLLAGGAPWLLLTHEEFATAWMHGPIGKYIVVLCLLVAPLLATGGRPYSAVAVATLAAGFWQFAAPASLIIYLGVVATTPRNQQIRVALGGMVAALATVVALVLPYVVLGAGSHLVAQSVVIPLLANSYGGGGLYTTLSSLDNWGLAFPFFVTGLLGTGVAAFRFRAARMGASTVYAPVLAWLFLGGLLLTQSGAFDQLVMTPFIAIGTAVSLDLLPHGRLDDIDPSLPEVRLRPLAGFVVLLIALAAFLLWAPYPAYKLAGHDIGQAYLSGAPTGGCHAHNNAIGDAWVDSFGRTGAECRTLREVLALLR